jgi:PAS domain S-box-containing protein
MALVTTLSAENPEARRAPTILIIEDTATQRAVLKHVVEQLGYRALTAADGDEGLRILDEQSPSLVLLDLIMPGRDGYAVAQAIRTRAKYVPIIALTSLTDLEAKRRGQQSGADDFITKPVDPVLLQIRVDAMLRIKALTDALDAANGRLSSLIESIPGGVWLIDDGNIVFANGRMAALLGVGSAEELLGRPALDLCAPEERQRMVARLARFAAGGAVDRSEEFHFVRPNGEQVVLEFCGLHTEYYDRPTLIEMVHDMTETKRMREQLALRDRISSLGRLAAGVGHEINNPLAFLLGNLEFALEQLEAAVSSGEHASLAEIVQALREAKEGGDRVRRIVRDMNTFAGRDTDKTGPIDVHRTLDWAAQIAGNEIRHCAQLIKEYGDVPLIQGSEARLSQVFLNLLVNAAHAIGDGNSQDNCISIRTFLTGDRVVIEIRDTGHGIAPEARARLFEPFFTTKPPGKGSGLGLSICYDIVTQMGGELAVDSEPGRGSCFRVILSAVGATVEAPAHAARPKSQSRRLKVLVVDDEPLICRFIERMLPEHEVFIQCDARAALASIEAGQQFDRILCDLMMPHMSGTTFFRKLSTLSPALASRVVFITGGAFTAETLHFLERIDRPTLVKPINPERLRKLLEDGADPVT